MNIRHHLAASRSTLLLPFALLAPALLAQAPTEGAALPDGIEANGDTAEVRALTAWAEENQYSHPAQARQAVERALVLARNLDDQRGLGAGLRILGNITVSADPYQAERYYAEALESFERIGGEHDVAKSRRIIGDAYRRRGELGMALEMYFDALVGFERLGDIAGQATVLNSIGNTHYKQGNLESALVYYERAVTMAETLDVPSQLAVHLANFGSALAEHGSYEKAEMILRRALAISEEQRSRYHSAAISGNLGALFNKQSRHEQALPHLFIAERLARELEQAALLGAVSDELAKAYLGLGQYDRALHYANDALAVAETLGPQEVMLAHQTLSLVYESAGNSDKALDHYRQYAAARDSVFNAEKTEIITEMQTRYETQEKQRANERLQQELQIQALRTSRWRAWMIGGVSGLLLLLGFLYYRYRIKQRANHLLEELDSAKSRFFANISHEFRTPLTVILGAAQDAIAGRFDGNRQNLTKQHRAILRNTRQLQRLVDEVLDLNRLEAGKLELKPAPGDLVRTLRRLVEAIAPMAERNGLDLTFEHDVEQCPRLYDEDKLEKIVGNLISNALKFTPKGGALQVALRSGSPVEIAVSDTGPGIPDEMQERVFERFAQVGDGGRHGGTGIGLALARELAELHGGTIVLVTEPGQGSTFTVRLPLKVVAIDDVVAPERRSAIDPSDAVQPEEAAIGGDGANVAPRVNGDADRTTVLVIEDNDDVRAYVRRSLEETYRVLEAADGEIGLQQAREELPDLIVSDVMLPGVDGYGVARRLKAEPDTECIPVVMLTARAAEEDKTEGYGSGAEVYITKPFSAETLRAAVARLLEERRRLRMRLQESTGQEKEETTRNGEPTLADRARATVLENLHDENFSVDELANDLGMSRSALERQLKPELGLTPGKFIQRLRLEQAKKLLLNGAGSVSEVAYAVGFKSLSHFTRSFREHHGELPSRVLGTHAETM